MSPVHKELRDAQADLVNRLRSEFGVVAERINLRGFYHSFRMWNSRMDNEKVRKEVISFLITTLVKQTVSECLFTIIHSLLA